MFECTEWGLTYSERTSDFPISDLYKIAIAELQSNMLVAILLVAIGVVIVTCRLPTSTISNSAAMFEISDLYKIAVSGLKSGIATCIIYSAVQVPHLSEDFRVSACCFGLLFHHDGNPQIVTKGWRGSMHSQCSPSSSQGPTCVCISRL